MTSTHECPANGCNAQVRRSQLMCPTHWRQVPAKLKTQLYLAWDEGEGFGSDEHIAAMAACIAAVNNR